MPRMTVKEIEDVIVKAREQVNMALVGKLSGQVDLAAAKIMLWPGEAKGLVTILQTSPTCYAKSFIMAMAIGHSAAHIAVAVELLVGLGWIKDDDTGEDLTFPNEKWDNYVDYVNTLVFGAIADERKCNSPTYEG